MCAHRNALLGFSLQLATSEGMRLREPGGVRSEGIPNVGLLRTVQCDVSFVAILLK